MNDLYKLMIIIGAKENRRAHFQDYPMTQQGLHKAEAMFLDAITRDYVLGVRLFRLDRKGMHELKRYDRKGG